MTSMISGPGVRGSGDQLKRAWVAYAAGRMSEAEFSCKLALAADKKSFDALHLMGLLELHNGRLESAQEFLQKAIRVNSGSASVFCNLGMILQYRDRHDEALVNFDKAIRLQPSHVQALNNKGHLLWRLKRHEEALEALSAALALKFDFPDALCNRGNVFAELKLLDRALADFDAALRQTPRDPVVLNNRANVLWALERQQEALDCYEQARAVAPQDLSVLKDYGSALMFSEREADALQCFETALARKPDDVYFTYKRGTALAKLNRFEEALACFDRALEFEAANVDALNGRGNVLSALARAAEAIASYDQAIRIDPETPEAHWNRSLTLLRMGEFEEGWREYEWRWKTANFTTKPRDFDRPLWLGDRDIAGKSILLHAEQGFGDTIQFARYIPLVVNRGAKVIVEAQPALKRLLSGLPGVDAVIAAGEQLPAFDVHCPLLSLPLACKTTLDSIPRDVPYLQASSETISKFSALRSGARLLVGVAWAGRSTYGGDKTRSIGLERMLPLLSLPGIQFVGIQKDLRPGDEALLSTIPNLNWVGNQLADFSDTAGLMANLDLVVSSDTSVVHLAGALNRPVWILLENIADWRWLLDRSDCPWYPSARLFRQRKADDWDHVIDSVAGELERYSA